MLPYKPSRIPLAQLPTQLNALDRLSEIYGGPRIWIKQDDQTGSVLSGNKIRKLEYVLAEAKSKACDTLITCGGIQSNHCRATATVAAQLGLKAHLILRGECADIAEGNLLLDKLSGAEISYYKPKHYFSELNSLFDYWSAFYKAQGRKAYCIPTGASDEVGLWGYISAAEELVNDFNNTGFKADALVVATGSGGTQGGLTLGMQLLKKDIPVFGMAVCDSEAYFRRKIHQDVAAWEKRWGTDLQFSEADIARLDVNTIDNYIGPGYAKAYPEVYECIKLLARVEGIVLDPVYTGKAFYGMLKEIESGCFREMENVVFIHTGGVFGLFPFKQEIFA